MNPKTPWMIGVATYNVLADAYIKPEYYARCDPEDFLPRNRQPKLDARIAALDTDVICLQEVEHGTFKRLDDRLRPLGYQGRWAHRSGSKPDGCATFVRAPWKSKAAIILDFDDEPQKPTNRVALMTIIERDGHGLVVVNTHLQWHPPDAAAEERTGLFQARRLLEHLRGQDRAIVCGDFNAEPETDVLEAFRAAGFTDAHVATPATFNLDGRPRKIDFLLHSPDLAATPAPTTLVSADTPLPSSSEPSDHVPLIATFAPTVR